MPPLEKPTFEDAITHLCSRSWAAENPGTRHHEETLLALLPASRTEEGRKTLGGAPNAIKNLTALLNDPLIFYNDIGAVAVRLLRNLCARSPENQKRALEAEAHLRVLDCIKQRLEVFDADMNGDAQVPAAMRRVEEPSDESHTRLRMPFFGFAVEFLCNFVTCNAENAAEVWNEAFPTLFNKLLECDNRAAASAAAALVHNCVAVLPERIVDIVKIWGSSDGQGRSLAHSILTQVRMSNDVDSAEEFEKFTWAYLVIKRLVEAGLFRQAFVALGPPLSEILTGKDSDFSADQETLLSVLDAAISKSAERPSRESTSDVSLPEGTLPFICELLEIARLKGNGNVLRLTLSISGSVIVMCAESPKLASVKMTVAKVGVETLKVLAKQDAEEARMPKQLGVHGLRASAIRAIALACDRYVAAQTLVRELQGLPLVLSALSYEKDPKVNPFLREWAVIAVRNLCLDNEANAADISSYELQGISQDQEFLERTGLEAYIDETSGQSRVRMRQSS